MNLHFISYPLQKECIPNQQFEQLGNYFCKHNYLFKEILWLSYKLVKNKTKMPLSLQGCTIFTIIEKNFNIYFRPTKRTLLDERKPYKCKLLPQKLTLILELQPDVRLWPFRRHNPISTIPRCWSIHSKLNYYLKRQLCTIRWCQIDDHFSKLPQFGKFHAPISWFYVKVS